MKKNEIKNLVEKFNSNKEDYLKQTYNESNTRTDFIDKFFELLGWDVRNDLEHAEKYRDVVREESLSIEGKPKAPDYTFRLGEIRKFFVEAKKPSVNIYDNREAAFQLRRYGFTANLSLSILTNFREFAVYDTTKKPSRNHGPSVARIFYINYEEYLAKWEFITHTFSKEAIYKGKFDEYNRSNINKRGTSQLDKEFLKQINEWRKILARNIALRNKSLSIYDLNYSVQKILDRIIFLRIAEEKGLEKYGFLRDLTKNKEKKYHLYEELIKYFKKADSKYNSGLFDFKEDQISNFLKIDYKVFMKIIKELYYPYSPYAYSVLPIEILGSIYEQFLGKTIRLTEGHQARIIDKPEIKKQGGVYYTPDYIVDFIVKNTVENAIKQKKSHKMIKDISIIDPACGSGSFLISAYGYLLDYYLDYYLDPKRKNRSLKTKRINEYKENHYKLTIKSKKEILIDHIYGVDIDPQAIEVTKLSLLLKFLENESLERTQTLFSRREMKLLPDLSENIKCGNSLVSEDFFEEQQLEIFGEYLIRKINTFNWVESFPEIFDKGGFDVVIGNPPYSNFSSKNSLKAYLKKCREYDELDALKSMIDYCRSHYPEVSIGCIDLYKWFIYKGIEIMKKSGKLGFIVPNTWYVQKNYTDIRELIFANEWQTKFYNLGEKVFQEKATVPTSIILIDRNLSSQNSASYDLRKEDDLEHVLSYFRNRKSKLEITKGDEAFRELLHNYSECTPLKKLITLREGQHIPVNKLIDGHDKKLIKIIDSKNMHRFYFNWFPLKSFPLENKRKTSSGRRIIIKKTGSKIVSSITPKEDSYIMQSLYHSIDYNEKYEPEYFVAILNSKLMNWIYQNSIYGQKGRTFAQFRKGYLDELPIMEIEFNNEKQKYLYNRIIDTTEKLFIENIKFHSSKSNKIKEVLKKELCILEDKLNELIYENYNISDSKKDEIQNYFND